MLSSTYPGSYYIKLHLNQKCFLGSKEAGGNITPVKPTSLILLLMLIENTSVIDGAGNGFSFVCGDDDFVKFQTLRIILSMLL